MKFVKIANALILRKIGKLPAGSMKRGKGQIMRFMLPARLGAAVLADADFCLHCAFQTLDMGRIALGRRQPRQNARTAVMARADRAAKNMTDYLLIFTAVIVAAILAGAPREQTLLGGQIFFFARLIYWPLYMAGISWLRTLSGHCSGRGRPHLARHLPG
jgi:uncharacterized MAPEG superfamily protein